MKFKVIFIFVSFVLLSNFILSSDSSEEMTAPLPPTFEPVALFDAQLARDFLQQTITVKTGLVSKATMTIAEDWKRTVQNEKDKDQEKNNTIDTKQNARKWIVAAYDIMIPFLKKKVDAQDQFQKLYLPYLQAHSHINFGVSKSLFAKKKYEDFINSDVLKNVMFAFGMKVLGYSTITIPGNEHPVGGHNKEKNKVSKKSAEDRAKNKKKYAKIDALEKNMLEQEKQIDAFAVLVNQNSQRLGLKHEYQKEIQKIMDQMKTEKAQLDALKAEVAKEIIEPERHKKRSGWLTMTNEKAVEILIEPALNQDSQKALEAAQKVLDVDESSSRADIEEAFTQAMKEIAQIENSEQQKIYTQAVKVAQEVLDHQAAKLDQSNEPISDEFRASIQEHGMKIAQQLLKDGKTINQMMDDPNFANVDWSPQQIAYVMGYVQLCMNMLQKITVKYSSESIVRMVEALKDINAAVH